MRKLLLLSLLALLCAPASSQAAPIYVESGAAGECPSDAQMAATPTYTRQYYVDPSLRCMFDTASNNIKGTDAEADLYLNSALGTAAGWGTAAPGDDWEGLGQNPTANGFSWTADAGNDDGTFTISGPLAAAYDQFAIAIKDGSVPYWAIFELSSLQLTGDWGLRTEGGSLSHFALFGRNTGVINPNCPNPPCEVISEVPEPTSLLLLGSGLAVAGKIRSRRKKR